MSCILQSPYIQEQLDLATTLYNDYIVPRLTKKNKKIAISTAVALSLIYFIRDRVLKPPKRLRHIPYITHASVIKSLITGETHWDRAYRVRLPIVDAPGTSGLYLEPGRGSWDLFLPNPEDVKRVMLKPEIYPKIPLNLSHEKTLFNRFMGGSNMAVLNGHQWKEQRKVANPAFHRSMPVKLFGKLVQDMFVVMETLENSVDVSGLMQRWTLDAIGKAGFGFDFNGISDRNNKWVNTYNTINKGIRNPIYFIFSKLDYELLWLFLKRRAVHKEMDRFLGMLDEVTHHKGEALAKGDVQNESLEENERDLLTLLIESEKRGEGIMSDEELNSNLCLFFIAGHDTTSSVLTFAIHYLAQHPDIQQKAREEAISILGDEPVDVLPITLRINGPIPSFIPRISAEDTELSGTFIPKNTLTNVGIFNTHHSDKLYKNSKEFNPDRFANDGEAIRGPGEGWSWIPFGNGARQCIGMNFSLNEQRVMLSMLLRKYTWETPPNSKHKDRVVVTGHLVLAPDNLDITFHKRY